jgi:acid stress-induced BolA-like protein IbaG/YrbA
MTYRASLLYLIDAGLRRGDVRVRGEGRHGEVLVVVRRQRVQRGGTSGPFISRSRIANQVSIDAYTVDNYFEAKFDTGILAWS